MDQVMDLHPLADQTMAQTTEQATDLEMYRGQVNIIVSTTLRNGYAYDGLIYFL